MQTKIQAIEKIVGSENFTAALSARTAYASSIHFDKQSPVLPLGVACPAHIRQIAQMLQFCSREGIPVIFRGGGTAILNPAIPLAPDTLVISSTGLNRIYDIEPENFTVRTDPGVTLAALARAVQEKGLFFPQRGWSGEAATIGGAIAVNAQGASAYGPVTNYVQKVDLLLSDGRTLTCHGANGFPGKLVPGFPLASLVCGSAGKLGFIGEASIRLLPAPKFRSWHFGRFADFAELAAICAKILPLAPACLDFLDNFCMKVVSDNQISDTVLAVEIHSDSPDLSQEAQEIMGNHGDPHITATDYAKWRSGVLPALKGLLGNFHLEVLSSPPAHFRNLLQDIEELAKERELQIGIFGLPGISRLYLALFAEGAQLMDLRQALFGMELMANDKLESVEEARLTREEWQRQKKEISDLDKSIARLFDPAGILSAQSGLEPR